MLTEAGDTFHEKDGEIEALKKLVTDYEEKLKQQVMTPCFALSPVTAKSLCARRNFESF